MNEKHDTELDEIFDWWTENRESTVDYPILKGAILTKYTSNSEVDRLVREARTDELNRASYTIVKTLTVDVDTELDHSDIQDTFETYQKLRAIELQPKDSKGDIE